MTAITRRDVVRSSALLLGTPLFFSSTAAPTLAQSSALATGSPEPPPLSSDLVQYVLEQHASTVALQLRNGSGATNVKTFADQWRLLATHLEDIGFDSYIRTTLPSLINSGSFTQVNGSFYDRMLDLTTQSVAQYGATLTREQLIGAVGSLPQGDVTAAITSFANNGMSTYCHKVADKLRSLSSNDSSVVPAAFNRNSTDALFTNVGLCWKGQTKQQQYSSCTTGETAIAGIILGVGASICVAIAPCGVALAAESAFTLGAGAFASVAALAGWLISVYCAPILA